MASIVTGFEAKARAKDEEHRRKVEEEVQRRRAQEQDSSKGENVWFSRRINDGHLYHWAIFTHGKKYELRLPSREKYKDMLPKGRLVGSVVPTFKYEARIAPWSLKDEMMQLRDESLAVQGKPHAQDYYICQIGWTTLTESAVDAECKAASSSFGMYVLGFNDCQSFLKRFASKIIQLPEGCALDYGWFAENIETPYHRLQEIAPDENMKAYQRYLQMSMGAMVGGTTGGAYVVYEREKPMEATQQGGSTASRADGNTGAPQSGPPKGGQQKSGGTSNSKDGGDCCSGDGDDCCSCF